MVKLFSFRRNHFFQVICMVFGLIHPVGFLTATAMAQDAVSQQKLVQLVQRAANLVMEGVNQATREQDRILSEAVIATDLSTLQSADELDRRLEAVRRVVLVNEKVIALLRAAPARATYLEDVAGLPLHQREIVFDSLKAALEDAMASKIILKMQADREWAYLQIERFQFMKKGKDKWKPAPEKGFVASSDDKFIDKFNEYTSKISIIQDKANALLDHIN